MAHTSEYEIEDIFIDRLEGIGYKFIKLNNYDEVLANFREQLAKFNAKKLEEKGHAASFSDSEFNRIMIHVDNHSVYESAKVLRDKYDLQLDNGESVYIEFFSGDTDRNIYQVTHQVTMDKDHKDDVVYKNRYDVTVLINGLPLVQIELKRPGVEINEAINQINRYRKFSFKGIFRYLQLFVVSNSVQTKYFCNENEMLDGQYNPILKSLVFFWTDEKNTRINDLNTFTGEFFRKSTITEMLNKYMVIKTTEPVLMVMRPYQIYAVRRIIMANTNTYQAQANELSQKLWAIANELRGQMDASEFKNYILGVIFYRYLSERTEMYMAEILENDGVTYEEAFADDDYRPVVEEWSLTKLGYVIRPENLFRNLIRKITKFESEADRFSVEDFEKAINDLVGSTMGHESNKAFDGLFNDMRLKDARLGETVADRTDMIGRVMVKVSDIDFDLQDSQFDVLGTAYMILIGLFASDAGKKGGEFFTPAGPSRLCATLASLGLDEAKTVGDCTCGSASMLLEVQKHLTTHKVGHFYGQELNATTYNLSRMNMIMHGVDWQNFDIYKGDTLKDDKYGYDLRLTVQVCNPPYSLKWSADKKFEDDPRYRGVGKLAPKSAADLAFVEHMLYHMDETDGRVAVLLPHGVLFRGGAEEAIRKYIIKDLNRLDAVIGLPANLFHGTGIPVCVLVLKSNRNGNSGNILFIDASKEFKPGKNQNILEQEHIDKIVDAYEKRAEIDKFAHKADMSEIIENDYNLNIPRYVDTFEEEEPVDLDAVRDRIKKLDSETKAAIDKAESFMRELGL